MQMTSTPPTPEKKRTRAQEMFLAAPEPYKELIRQILQEEREVMHLQRRADIHQRLYEHIRRLIK